MDKAMHSEFEGHTPGPWKVISMRPHGVMRDIYFISPNGRFEYNICEITNSLGVNTKANADLIAKAPDLLKENQSLRSELQNLKGEYQKLYGNYDKHDGRINSLLAELQKQKELNAELVRSECEAFTDYLLGVLWGITWPVNFDEQYKNFKAESLIKKSKES